VAVPIVIVASEVKDWPFELPDVEVTDARAYLTRPDYSTMRGVRLFNLCRSYRYQSTGYYVSLLAEARGHKPLPSVTTIQDLKSQTMVRLVSEDLEELIQESLAPIHGDKFTLSIYFGRNMVRRYDRLASHLFDVFEAPLLRAQFARIDTSPKRQRGDPVAGAPGLCGGLAPQGDWSLRSLAAISADEIPEGHRDFVARAAQEYFAGRKPRVRKPPPARYDLAILHDPNEPDPPSDNKAIGKFIKAAASLGLNAEVIERDDFARLAEYDALFIRETTAVNHHTYRFAQRAQGEGLIVIDDPESIVKCTNKVYLAELLNHHEVPTPRTMVVHRDNVEEVGRKLGFPCVLKKPDSAFSMGVVRVASKEELKERLGHFLEESELLVAQEFLPTAFDWRIGIFDRRPLFACKYYMAQDHWQIAKRDGQGKNQFGKCETVPVELAPRKAVRLALKAADLIGDGLYGVDVKQTGDKFCVIEVNDNPNIDAGVEDQVLRDELYRRIMSVFLSRIQQKKAGVVNP
jgi:glutathione synthase/RimK-type ligase-like ATP-grasp enzyme